MSFKRNDTKKGQLILEQHKLASVLNIDSNNMFEAYDQPTMKYKSITIVTIITIIYNIHVG